MKKAAIITHTADRLPMLRTMLDQLARFGPLRGWEVYLVAQGYTRDTVAHLKALPSAGLITDALMMPARTGPHSAKVLALHKWSADVWLTLEDDMLLLPETDWSGALHLLEQPGAGFVTSGSSTSKWQANRDMAKVYRPRSMARALVSTGGGLLFTDETAQLVRDLPDCYYLFDDIEWSLAAYKSGRTNHKFFGSWLIHTEASTPGRGGFKIVGKVLPDPELLPMQYIGDSGTQVAYPLISGLTLEAHRLNRTNKRARGWAEE